MSELNPSVNPVQATTGFGPVVASCGDPGMVAAFSAISSGMGAEFSRPQSRHALPQLKPGF